MIRIISIRQRCLAFIASGFFLPYKVNINRNKAQIMHNKFCLHGWICSPLVYGPSFLWSKSCRLQLIWMIESLYDKGLRPVTTEHLMQSRQQIATEPGNGFWGSLWCKFKSGWYSKIWISPHLPLHMSQFPVIYFR